MIPVGKTELRKGVNNPPSGTGFLMGAFVFSRVPLRCPELNAIIPMRFRVSGAV